MRYSPSSDGITSFSISRAVNVRTGIRCEPRTTSSSWKSTASPSRVWRTSNSTASTPKLSAKSRLSIVFSRARRGAPRWPTIQVPWACFHSLMGAALSPSQGRVDLLEDPIQGRPRVRRARHRASDDEQVRSGGERRPGRRHALLVLDVGAGGTDAGHDGEKPGPAGAADRGEVRGRADDAV